MGSYIPVGISSVGANIVPNKGIEDDGREVPKKLIFVNS